MVSVALPLSFLSFFSKRSHVAQDINYQIRFLPALITITTIDGYL